MRARTAGTPAKMTADAIGAVLLAIAVVIRDGDVREMAAGTPEETTVATFASTILPPGRRRSLPLLIPFPTLTRCTP